MSTSTEPAVGPPSGLRRFLRRGLRTAIAGVAVALVLSLVWGRDPWRSVAYVTSIAVSCWFFIDSGRLLAARWRNSVGRGGAAGANAHWPGWGAMVVVILVGTALGFSVGNLAGNALTGRDSPGLLSGSPRNALALLMVSLIPGVAVTYFFYSRERIAATEAKAQTAQRQAAENQLRLLESQLEPHMLFNTLANLRVLIGIDPPRAQAMLDRLIAFLRATLDASRVGQHALQQEFARVGDYLALMQVRMGPRLQSQLELPAELAALPIAPLLLQPLVENAIKHGLEPKVEGGRIEVRAMHEGEQLVITVRDDGMGLAAPGADGSHFGLQQVRERLATLYGPQASVDLSSPMDGRGGTLACVRIPWTPSPRA
jgi:signal transduction histidine kinase